MLLLNHNNVKELMSKANSYVIRLSNKNMNKPGRNALVSILKDSIIERTMFLVTIMEVR